MSRRLLDTVKTQEEKKTTGSTATPIESISNTDLAYAKSKIISAKVNPEMWDRFKQLSRMAGSTANGMLNQLINDYVMRKDKEMRDLNAM